MAPRLKDRVAIVTGGAQGIGRAYAEALAGEGAAIAIVDTRRERAEETAAVLRAIGARAIVCVADVAKQDEMDAVARATFQAFGRIDVLMNNAAIYHDMNIGDQSLEYLRQMLDVNLLGILVCVRAVFPTMKAQRSGSIINISSGAAYPDRLGMAGRDLETVPSFAYGLAKSGVVYYMKSMARALGHYGIRVNAIAPGVTMTEATRKIVSAGIIDRLRSAAALGRTLEPTDLVGTALYLASDDSALMTAQTLSVDGGVAMLG